MCKTTKTTRRKVGRPQVAEPKRGKSAHRKGSVIAGKKILSVTCCLTETGRKEKRYGFLCACGSRFQTTESTVTRAKRGKALLRCKRCQDAAELAGRCKAPAVALPEPAKASQLPEHRRIAGLSELPELLGKTNQLIRKLAETPDVLEAVKGIVAAHLHACLENGAPLENLDGVWNEAAGLVKRGEVDLRWTPDTITEGLCRVSYGQYSAPRDTGMI